MAKFVDKSNNWRPDGGVYKKVIDQIDTDGVCPFCPKHLKKYHKKPIIKRGKYWLVTDNMYPYNGAKHHILFIHKKHIESLEDVSTPGFKELKDLIKKEVKRRRIKGATFLMRFGETSHTGASVSHLHANLISPDVKRKDRKPIMFRIG